MHRYAPDGRLDRTIRFPVTLTTKAVFGGPKLDDLYVTSAWIDLDDDARQREPQAGGVFRVPARRSGVRPHRFAG